VPAETFDYGLAAGGALLLLLFCSLGVFLYKYVRSAPPANVESMEMTEVFGADDIMGFSSNPMAIQRPRALEYGENEVGRGWGESFCLYFTWDLF